MTWRDKLLGVIIPVKCMCTSPCSASPCRQVGPSLWVAGNQRWCSAFADVRCCSLWHADSSFPSLQSFWTWHTYRPEVVRTTKTERRMIHRITRRKNLYRGCYYASIMLRPWRRAYVIGKLFVICNVSHCSMKRWSYTAKEIWRTRHCRELNVTKPEQLS